MPTPSRSRLNAAKARTWKASRAGFARAPFTGVGGSGYGNLRFLLPGSQYDWERQMGEPQRNSAVAACLRWIVNNAPEPTLVVSPVGDRNRAPIERHPLVRLCARPNDQMDRFALLAWTALSMLVDGNAYWAKVRSSARRVVQVWPLHHELMAPTYPPDGSEWITGWTYRINGRQYPIDPDDVVHFKWGWPDLQNDRLFTSPLKTACREIVTDNEVLGFNASLMKNLGVPGLALVPAVPDTFFTREQADLLRSQARENYTGDNRGNWAVFSGPVKLEKVTLSPEELALDKALRLHESRIAAAIGLPPQVVGLLIGNESKTHANWQEARRSAYEDFLIPFHKAQAATLQAGLLPDLVPDPDAQEVRWDYSNVQCLAENEADRVKRANDLLLAGQAMRSETRAMVGLEATPADEVYYVPAGVTVVGGDNFPVARPPDLDTAGDPDATEDESEGLDDAPPADAAEVEAEPGDAADEPGKPAKALPAPATRAGEPVDDRGPGVMVGFWLPADLAADLAVPGGEPATELHLTLGYLGRADEVGPEGVDLAARICAGFAGRCAPLAGVVAGIGRFSASPTSDGKDVIYASADLPGLPAFRQALVESLEAAGLAVRKDHGFTPHVTLAYVEPDAPSPVARIPARPVRFDALTFAAGDDRRAFPLAGTSLKSAVFPPANPRPDGPAGIEAVAEADRHEYDDLTTPDERAAARRLWRAHVTGPLRDLLDDPDGG